MDPLNVLAISGSLRKDSYNRKALQIAKSIAQNQGATVKEIDLKVLNLPIFDEDIEQPTPMPVKELMDAAASADVFIITSPEYNRSISGALKNAIDWLSRDAKRTLVGKWAIVLGVSGGKFGTIRGQAHLKSILSYLDVYVAGRPEIYIGLGQDVFDENGNFKDPKTKELLDTLVTKTLKMASAMKGADKQS